MRVVLTSWGSRGDVEPVVALAVRLRELGAGATLCVPPEDEFIALADAFGVPLVPLGPTVRSIVGGDRPPGPDAAFRLAAELVAARFDTLTTVAEGCDALLATGLMPAGVRSVAELLGIRYVLACFQTLGLPSAYTRPGRRPGRPSSPDETDLTVLWRDDAERVDALYGGPLNRHRAAVGLPPVDNVRDHVFGDRPWLAADPALVPWRPGLTHLDVVQTGAWLLPDGRPLPPELTAFLDAGPPPVYVGFGSMPMWGSAEPARAAVDAVRAHGHRILLGRGRAELAAVDDGDDCFVVGDVNHRALFGRVAAVVHHGGAGTTTTAARAGAPQVLVPQVADQPVFAARVAELGIGAAHDGAELTVGSLTAALATALDPGTRDRARELAGTIRTDGTTVAAELLLTS